MSRQTFTYTADGTTRTFVHRHSPRYYLRELFDEQHLARMVYVHMEWGHTRDWVKQHRRSASRRSPG